MAGAEIFVMYQDGNGNVTLSTRNGQGHVMPRYTDRSDVDLLAGSGVSNGEMIANVRCGSCSSLDLSGNNNWITAWLRGDSLASSDPRETISVHDDNQQLTVDFAQARVSSDTNPFVESGGNGNESKPPPSNSGSGSGSGGAVQTGGGDNTSTLILAHGIVMTIVFAAAYPLGALLMPIARKWYIHSTWQTLAFLAMWAGFALGYVSSSRLGIVSSPSACILRKMLTFCLAVLCPTTHEIGNAGLCHVGCAARSRMASPSALSEASGARYLQLRPYLLRPDADAPGHYQRWTWSADDWKPPRFCDSIFRCRRSLQRAVHWCLYLPSYAPGKGSTATPTIKSIKRFQRIKT